MSYIDFHVIQNVPSSNINRDDTGTPKTALYGGYRRARVSSQAWKHAIREDFKGLLSTEDLGVRTKYVPGLIAEKIIEKRPDLEDSALGLAQDVLFKGVGIKKDEGKRKGEDEGRPATSYLVFISNREVSGLSDVAISWADEGYVPGGDDKGTIDKKRMKKDCEQVFHGAQAIDIALFGRMLADAPQLNTDASCQVAHAISVDAVTQEYDYFTAVDECASEDNAGAAMLDTVTFNSSTLYRYATINLDSLVEQLGDTEAAARAVCAFAEAFVRAMPSGKQNSFANRTLPKAVLVSINDVQPFNAVGAFERPVRSKDDASVSRQAASLLGTFVKDAEEAYDIAPVKSWNIVEGEGVPELDEVAERVTLGKLTSALHDEVLSLVEKRD
jgi:CRISPR system Cascade subunit CasC